MGWIIGGFVAGTVWLSLAIAVLVGVCVPLAWLWMLVDALLREEWDYPGATAASNNRLLWVALIFFVHWSAIAYYLMVYRPMRAARAAGNAVPAVA